MSDKRIYVTTPIYYVNAEPHLGHAYTSIVCDAARRYYRILGYDTRFQTGVDEHGEKIMLAAQAAGLSPLEFCDRISQKFRDILPELLVEPDDFIRTTEKRHTDIVQRILTDLFNNGDIYKADYEGVYCVQCERFYTEKELEADKPNLCPIHEVPLQRIREENYFFRMSKYQDWLREKIQSEPDFLNPPQYANEVLSILSEPLDDLCISRPKARLHWGIPIPFDEDFVVYVWFDALVNYLSTLGYPDGAEYERFWPSVQHVIAKDILRPHAVFWPTMLKAMGAPIYRRLHIHGYWQSGGKKMSKSLGNVIDPREMASRYSPDAVRYFVLREMAFGFDGDFTERALIKRYNSDLANDFGNLVSRVTAMIRRYRDGAIPGCGTLADGDYALLHDFERARAEIPEFLERLRLHDVIERVMKCVRATNRYIDQCAPWDLAKNRKDERLDTTLHTAAKATALAAGLLWPVMPDKCDAALRALGANPAALDGPGRWNGDGAAAGQSVGEAVSIFPRVEVEETETPPRPAQDAGESGTAQETPRAKKIDGKPGGARKRVGTMSGEPMPEEKSKTMASRPPIAREPEDSPAKAPIDYETFSRVDLRVGRVVVAEKHPKADRLLRLEVDLGAERRQIVAGIAETYDPAQLIGKQVVVVANLKPRALRGIESHGMLLAATDAHGLKLVTVDAETEPGAGIG